MKYGNGESCENCKFSVLPVGLPAIDFLGKVILADNSNLCCHRYPPKFAYDLKKKKLLGGFWPTTGKDDWCGEYKLKTSKNNK